MAERREPLVERYRPRFLDEVVGQDEVVRGVKNLLDRGLNTHLLFIGPPGVDKTTVAMCIAREFYYRNWEAVPLASLRGKPERSEELLDVFFKFNARLDVNLDVIRGRRVLR